jgi:glycosyltransferase involved in cell wall biosynthesis
LRRGKQVGVDFEDWFSKGVPATAQRTRPVTLLQRCEGILAREAAYCVTTSGALASALADAYTAPTPRVVWNAFPWDERQTIDGELRDRRNRDRLSVCWFSQTVGPGRGLEVLAAATHYTRSRVEIHLRGACDAAYAEQIRSLAHPSVRDHLHIHTQVPHDQLASRIAEHDVGLAGELADCANHDLTIANKVFQYFLSGLPVVASATAGQREVQRAAPQAVQLFEIGDAQGLAAALDRWAAPDVRHLAAQAALAAARDEFAWDKCAATIREGVAAAIGASSASGRRQLR